VRERDFHVFYQILKILSYTKNSYALKSQKDTHKKAKKEPQNQAKGHTKSKNSVSTVLREREQSSVAFLLSVLNTSKPGKSQGKSQERKPGKKPGKV